MAETKRIETSLEELMPIIEECLGAGKSFRFFPMGISMLPMLRERKDSVLLSPAPEKLSKYDIPLYKRDNGKYVLHRIIKVDENYTCMGDNQFIEEHGIRHDQVIAVVTGFYRNKKFYSVSSFCYRIYCRFWHYSHPLRHFWRRGIGFLRRCLK